VKKREVITWLVVVAGVIAYCNSFTGPFIYDDVPSILENTTIRHLWPIWRALSPPQGGDITVTARPLPNLTLAINYALAGYQVWGYHALNLVVHILAALTLLGIVRRTLLLPKFHDRFRTTADELSLAVAILWLVHPLQTESVTYIIQRTESIMGLCYLLTLYCFIRGAETERPGRWQGFCLLACAAGMASKEVMASAPLIVLLYDRTFLTGSFREAWRQRRALYTGLAATWILLSILLVQSFRVRSLNSISLDVAPWQYFLTQAGVITHYLRLSIWPHPLCFDYFGWPIVSTWASALPSALVLGIALGCLVWGLWRNSVWAFLGAWFVLILAPSSSFITLDSPAYEHRMYLPLAAVMVTAVLGIHALLGKRAGVAYAVLAFGLVFLTWQRNEDYRSGYSIWADTVAKRPGNARAQSNLGTALGQLGRTEEAIVHWTEALRIRPSLEEPHYGLGVVLAEQGKLPEAMNEWEQAVKIRPSYAEAHYNLGVAAEQLGKTDEAIAHYQQAVEFRPNYAKSYNNLGSIFLRQGRLAEAIDDFQNAVKTDPDFTEAHYNFGIALEQAGRIQEAIQEYETALRLNPSLIDAQNRLTRLLAVAHSAS
jgi:protein O-mannosyl-transferase